MIDARNSRVARDRNNPLQAYVTPDERKAVAERAAAAGMTVSAYIRAACLSPKVAAPTDLRAVETLAKINADQARLSALLRLHLHESQPDRTATARLLDGIANLQLDLKETMRKIKI